MISPNQLTGAVLAGGHSRRMGRDKAGLIIGGEPLWARQAGVLRTAGAQRVGLVRRRDQAELILPTNIALWYDSVTDIGPLAGLLAALESSRTEFVAILAIDLPRMDASWFEWLAAACTTDCGAMAQHADGAFEPLAAIYPRAALSEIRARVSGRDFSLQALATALVTQQRLAALPLPDDRLTCVENWNLPEDARATAEGSTWVESASSLVHRS